MENKQTAVEWLTEKLRIEFVFVFSNDILEQAIEMEKQQIIDAYRDGRSDQQSERPSKFYNRNAKYYYNETFKQNEKSKIAQLIEWIDTEPNLVKVKDGFLYHGQYFTNQQIIEIYAKRG